MPATVNVTKFPADHVQKQMLAKLFSSSEYLLLLEILKAHCIEAQVGAMNSLIYQGNNDRVNAELETHTERATAYSKALDVLDEIGKSEQEWFTVTLEPSR